MVINSTFCSQILNLSFFAINMAFQQSFPFLNHVMFRWNTYSLRRFISSIMKPSLLNSLLPKHS